PPRPRWACPASPRWACRGSRRWGWSRRSRRSRPRRPRSPRRGRGRAGRRSRGNRGLPGERRGAGASGAAGTSATNAASPPFLFSESARILGMMRKLLCTAALIGLVPASAGAAVLDPNFVESDYVTSPALAAATGLAWAPDGSNRLFVSRKDGQILVI